MFNRKQFAVVIGIIYLVSAIFVGLIFFWKFLLYVIFSLVLIIFNEEMGYYQGFLGRIGPKITEESPAVVVEFMGWLFLLIPAVFFVLSLLRS